MSRAGTKTDTAIVEVPQGLSVVTREQMDRQDVHSVGDSLRYTPGAYADSRPGGVLESVFLRGFGGFAAAAINPQMLDGLPLPKGVNWAASVVDPWTLERIDVLRGPASVLYGQAAGRHRRHGQQAAHARCAAPARRADRQPRSRAACI